MTDSASDRVARIGKNEALFREVNERIREITAAEADAEFLCECGNQECTVPIRLALDEYEAIRSDARHFLVVPGHETRDVEQVVARTDRYAVVEKRPGPPTELAARTDPRD